jgi:very-short-patch-repair endonuclease
MPDGISYTRAKVFRRVMTPPEARLWARLSGKRLNGVKFRRQHPVGPYILDFYCAWVKLAVEVDGASHNTEERAAHDRRRTAWLATQGIRVIRLRASDVRDEIEGVMDFIQRSVRERVPPGYHGVAPS